MAKLPTTIRTQLSDVRDAEPWFTKFLGIQNTFNQAFYDCLTGNITFTENIHCFFKEFNFTTRIDYLSGGWDDISFPNTLGAKATMLLVCQFYGTENNADPLLDSPFPTWKDINGNILISYISGLDNATPYFFRLMVA